MIDVVSGIIFALDAVVAMFFLKYWAASRDRLFLMFASAFAILGVQRILLAATRQIFEDQALFYTMRLAAFLIIIVAIVDKNRR